MKILVVGGGGREHAIVWKLSGSPRVDRIYCAPGNGGIAQIAECIDINPMDIKNMVQFAKSSEIDMAVVAPDDPLAAGMVDAMEEAGIRAFGPRKDAAVIESSKSFAKQLMKEKGIPTAGYEVFDHRLKALKYLKNQDYPIVVKADGLALGKGVIIANNYNQAAEAVNKIMADKAFGDAGNSIVIEEFLTGQEVTVLAFTDGKTVVPMLSSQDHKRALDNDEGLNTGGMGAFSPSRIYTKDLSDYCMEKIFKPTVEAMNEKNRSFKGVLYFGLMLTRDGIRVIEYNSRFGDPEAQVILPRLKNDLVDIFEAVIDESLDSLNIEWEDNAAVCVVMASGGYPVEYAKGYGITGINKAEEDRSVIVFHAGTKYRSGSLYTSGGRVLGVTALDSDLEKSRKRAYKAVSKIEFKDRHYRTDIGLK